MLSQVIGEALIVGFQGLVVLGLFLFLQSLWRDLAFLFSRHERRVYDRQPGLD